MTKDIIVKTIRPIDPEVNFINNHFEFLENKINELINTSSNDEYHFITEGLVSNNPGISDINHSIVQNILSSDIVIAIISGLNPNVMFELGMRLSLKKVTIIISDDKTKLPFDIHSFYTIFYPKDMNAPEFDKFKNEFKKRFINTWNSFAKNGGKDTFISKFEDVTTIDPKVDKISLNQAIEKLSSLINVMQSKYIAWDPNDDFDSFNFDHDVSSPVSLKHPKK